MKLKLSKEMTAVPNAGPNQLLWNPEEKSAAMSAVGCRANGKLIFLSVAGNPAQQPECLIEDLVEALWYLGAADAVLLGISGDVQQYICYASSQGELLVAQARRGSSMPRNLFPYGRPLSSAIIVEAKG
jgi:hypothetical protein